MAPEFFQGLLQSIQPFNLLAMAAGSIAGLIFGMVPGLTTTTATIVFLPLTFVLSPSVSVALLFGIYTGGFTGSAFSATLINIPGGPSAAATLLDGHPIAKRGEGARALGIGITAIMLSALIIHGLAPGPLLFLQNAAFAYTMIATFFCAVISTAVIAFLGVKWIVKALAVSRALLLPAIPVCCFVGAYAPRNSMFDVFCMFGFGLLGVAFRWLNIPAIPLVLALALGQQLETHLPLALMSSQEIIFDYLTTGKKSPVLKLNY